MLLISLHGRNQVLKDIHAGKAVVGAGTGMRSKDFDRQKNLLTFDVFSLLNAISLQYREQQWEEAAQ
ncbi:hypothetical protein KEM55_001703 [Ascosphaera atra]|nr:hypothetical protein KEM55_001703 [Ascosphaera atra]